MNGDYILQGKRDNYDIERGGAGGGERP